MDLLKTLLLLVFLLPPSRLGAEGFQLRPAVPSQPMGMERTAEALRDVGDLKTVQGRLWAATRAGLLSMELKTAQWGLAWDGKGELVHPVRQLSYSAPYLWAACDNGLFRLDPAGKKLARFTQKDGLVSDAVRCVAADPGGVWIGYSLPDGAAPGPGGIEESWTLEENRIRPYRITRMDSTGKVLRHWNLPEAPSHKSVGTEGGSLTWQDNRVLHLMAEDGRLWLAQNGCLLRLEPSKGSWKSWSFESITFLESLPRSGTVQLFHEKGRVLAASDRPFPALWMAYDPGKDSWSVIPPQLQLPAAQGQDLTWVGSSYDLTSASRFVLRYIKDKETSWKDEGLVTGGYTGMASFHCILPGRDIIWLGGPGGLYRYKTGGKEFTRFIPILETSPKGEEKAYVLKVLEKKEGARPAPPSTRTLGRK